MIKTLHDPIYTTSVPRALVSKAMQNFYHQYLLDGQLGADLLGVPKTLHKHKDPNNMV